MLVVGIILAICGIALLICPLIFDCDKLWGIFLIVAWLLITLSIHFIYLSKKNTEKDVLNGKATYQETIHIIDNGTIKTYQIVWRQNN